MALQILRGAVDVSDVCVDRLRTTVVRHGRTVFNPDKLRSQATIRMDSSIVRSLAHVLDTRGFLCGRTLGTTVILSSEPGCKKQAWHTDYDANAVASLRVKPLGVLLALQDGTRFEEFPNTTHILDRGDVLIFDGDVVHAGAAYGVGNIRIHAYVDSNEHTRERNTTYLL